jgi:hypothetical protein
MDKQIEVPFIRIRVGLTSILPSQQSDMYYGCLSRYTGPQVDEDDEDSYIENFSFDDVENQFKNTWDDGNIGYQSSLHSEDDGNFEHDDYYGDVNGDYNNKYTASNKFGPGSAVFPRGSPHISQFPNTASSRQVNSSSSQSVKGHGAIMAANQAKSVDVSQKNQVPGQSDHFSTNNESHLNKHWTGFVLSPKRSNENSFSKFESGNPGPDLKTTRQTSIDGGENDKNDNNDKNNSDTPIPQGNFNMKSSISRAGVAGAKMLSSLFRLAKNDNDAGKTDDNGDNSDNSDNSDSFDGNHHGIRKNSNSQQADGVDYRGDSIESIGRSFRTQDDDGDDDSDDFSVYKKDEISAYTEFTTFPRIYEILNLYHQQRYEQEIEGNNSREERKLLQNVKFQESMKKKFPLLFSNNNSQVQNLNQNNIQKNATINTTYPKNNNYNSQPQSLLDYNLGSLNLGNHIGTAPSVMKTNASHRENPSLNPASKLIPGAYNYNLTSSSLNENLNITNIYNGVDNNQNKNFGHFSTNLEQNNNSEDQNHDFLKQEPFLIPPLPNLQPSSIQFGENNHNNHHNNNNNEINSENNKNDLQNQLKEAEIMKQKIHAQELLYKKQLFDFQTHMAQQQQLEQDKLTSGSKPFMYYPTTGTIGSNNYTPTGALPISKYSFMVDIYFPLEFHALRTLYCGGDVDIVQSLTQSTNWNASGGKSGSTFAKTNNNKFILKYVNLVEFQMMLETAQKYFNYTATSASASTPSSLVKILGLYTICLARKESKEKSSKKYVVLMSNLFYGREHCIEYVFDLKGSLRNRYIKNHNYSHKLENEFQIVQNKSISDAIEDDDGVDVDGDDEFNQDELSSSQKSLHNSQKITQNSQKNTKNKKYLDSTEECEEEEEEEEEEERFMKSKTQSELDSDAEKRLHLPSPTDLNGGNPNHSPLHSSQSEKHINNPSYLLTSTDSYAFIDSDQSDSDNLDIISLSSTDPDNDDAEKDRTSKHLYKIKTYLPPEPLEGVSTLLDMNLVEFLGGSALPLTSSAFSYLKTAVYNDATYLTSLTVVDYSLLIAIDTVHNEIVCGIIDYARQYTWDKRFETSMKKMSNVLAGKVYAPTVIPPDMYKHRFILSVERYFCQVLDTFSIPDLFSTISTTKNNYTSLDMYSADKINAYNHNITGRYFKHQLTESGQKYQRLGWELDPNNRVGLKNNINDNNSATFLPFIQLYNLYPTSPITKILSLFITQILTSPQAVMNSYQAVLSAFNSYTRFSTQQRLPQVQLQPYQGIYTTKTSQNLTPPSSLSVIDNVVANSVNFGKNCDFGSNFVHYSPSCANSINNNIICTKDEWIGVLPQAPLFTSNTHYKNTSETILNKAILLSHKAQSTNSLPQQRQLQSVNVLPSSTTSINIEVPTVNIDENGQFNDAGKAIVSLLNTNEETEELPLPLPRTIWRQDTAFGFVKPPNSRTKLLFPNLVKNIVTQGPVLSANKNTAKMGKFVKSSGPNRPYIPSGPTSPSSPSVIASNTNISIDGDVVIGKGVEEKIGIAQKDSTENDNSKNVLEKVKIPKIAVKKSQKRESYVGNSATNNIDSNITLGKNSISLHRSGNSKQGESEVDSQNEPPQHYTNKVSISASSNSFPQNDHSDRKLTGLAGVFEPLNDDEMGNFGQDVEIDGGLVDEGHNFDNFDDSLVSFDQLHNDDDDDDDDNDDDEIIDVIHMTQSDNNHDDNDHDLFFDIGHQDGMRLIHSGSSISEIDIGDQNDNNNGDEIKEQIIQENKFRNLIPNNSNLKSGRNEIGGNFDFSRNQTNDLNNSNVNNDIHDFSSVTDHSFQHTMDNTQKNLFSQQLLQLREKRKDKK